MAGLEEGGSPSNPPNPAASPKSSFPGSGENNENYSGQDQMIPNFQNPRKIGEKHFMSPTISAASKVAPRKNILVERDENSSSTYSKHHMISSIDHKRNSRNQNISHSGKVLSCSQTSASDDEGDTNLHGTSRLKPYNSLTNYLSPRPKYLRFNPNRRREILNRLEKEANEELNCIVHDEDEDSSGEGIKESCISPVIGTVMNQQNEGNTEVMHSDSEEEEEEVEFEEERGWCLKGVFKILITLIACFLSTSYICSMNSSSPLPLEQTIWDAKGGYLVIQNETLGIISKKMWDTGFLSVEERHNYLCSHEVEIIENDIGGRLELDEVEIEENDNGERKERVGEKTVGDDEVGPNGLEEEISGNDVDIDVNIDKSSEIVDVEGGFRVVQLEDAKAAESSDYDAYGMVNEVAAEKEAVEGDEVETETYIFQEVSTNINECEEMEDSVHEVDMKLNEDNKGTLEKAERSILFGIGLSVVSISLALLAFFYCLVKNVRSTSGENSCPVLDAPKFDVDDKSTSFAMEKKIEISIPPLQTPLMEEVPKDLNQNIHVPTVELIGEIVVGGSSSFRSYKKNKIVGSEESSDSLFHDKSSLCQPLSAPTQPLPMEFYTPTFERKTLKKEGSKNRKATIEVTPTPVRRSTRLRKTAAFVSP